MTPPGPEALADALERTVRELLRTAAPHLVDAQLAVLSPGRDNSVIRVGDDLVARLPRHPDAARLSLTEQQWLATATAAVTMAVPEVVVAGRPSDAFPFPWSLHRWVPGRTADSAAVEAGTAAAALSGLWRELHRPTPPDAPRNAWRGVPLRARLARHGQALAAVAHPQAGRLLTLLERLADLPEHAGPAVWCHGDLHPRNLVAREGRLVGVIDWGDLHAGDPAVDLAAAWLLLDEPEQARDGRDDGLWQRGRGWGLVLGALLLEIGVTDDDEGFRRIGSGALSRVV